MYASDKIIRIFKMMYKAEGGDINRYDCNSLVNYQCQGYDLIGSTCNTKDSRRHFLVTNNHYDVWEIPLKSNNGLRMTGTFLVLIYNVDFGCWYFAKMKHHFTISDHDIIKEIVSYCCYGELRISYNERTDLLSYYCLVGEGLCSRGIRSAVFDSFNVRKELGYHTTMNVIHRRMGLRLM